MEVGVDDKSSGGHWFAFILVFLLVPIIFRPWWMAVVSIAIFGLLMKLPFPGILNSK